MINNFADALAEHSNLLLFLAIVFGVICGMAYFRFYYLSRRGSEEVKAKLNSRTCRLCLYAYLLGFIILTTLFLAGVIAK